MTREEKFHRTLIQAYKTAAKECKYRSKVFYNIAIESGGVAAAKHLLAVDKTQSSIYELFTCRRLDLTVESLVLQPEFRILFTPEELAEADARLKSVRRVPKS